MSEKYKKVIDKTKSLLDFAVECDYRTMIEFIKIMEERYDFLKVTCIGESVLAKKIYMLSLGNEKAEKSVLYVGAHHGAEWITTLILLRLVNEMCEYFKTSKHPFGINLNSLFSSRCIHIIPMLNPDGVDIQLNGVKEGNILYDRLMKMSGGDFSKWQANARGVDLNHNYNYGFCEYKKLEIVNGIAAGKSRYSGECPLSEPETSALASFLAYDNSVEMILTLHSAGEVIYCGNIDKAQSRSKIIAKKLSLLSGYEVSEPEGLASFGGLTDWFTEKYKKPSYTIECGKGETPIHQSKYFEIYAMIREMLMTAPLLI